MNPTVTNRIIAVLLIVKGIALAAAGIFIGMSDDAPGAALLGIVLIIGMVGLGMWLLRHKS